MCKIDIRSNDGKHRYVFGIDGDNPIIIFALNPSDGKHPRIELGEKYDPTQIRIKNITSSNGYDGWIILNLFPVIATYPEDLKGIWNRNNESCRETIEMNIRYIKDILKDYPESDIWATWGNNIEQNRIFIEGFLEIMNIIGIKDRNWIYFDKLNGTGHPKHPLYMKKDVEKTKLTEIQLNNCIKNVSKLRFKRA